MTTTRRRFLTSTTALAAGTWVAPRFTIGQSGPSANSKINLAWIGIGGRGALNLQAWYDAGVLGKVTRRA
jgi:hypothetical protein